MAQDVAPDRIATVATAELRYEGVDATLTVTLATTDEMQAAFEATHRSRFGFVSEKRLIVETISVEAIAVAVGAEDDSPLQGEVK